MISSLRGILLRKAPDRAVVEVAGVGFAVHVLPSAYQDLPAADETVVLYTHMVVREDDIRLFGFLEERERDAFAQLIEIQNVGPKLASSILATLPLEALAGVVLAEDPKRLAEVPGIGKKTAEKLLLELRDRYDKLFGGGKVAVRPDQLLPGKGREVAPGGGNGAECRAALAALGFSALEIEKRLRAIGDVDTPPVEATVRRFLQMAARGEG